MTMSDKDGGQHDQELLNEELLKTLEDNERLLRARIREIEREIKSVKLEIFKLKTGVGIGSIVMDRNGKLFRVTDIDPNYWWVEGNPQRKDGTFGTSTRDLYGEWTLKC